MIVGELIDQLQAVKTVLELDDADWRALRVIVHTDLGAADVKDVVTVHKGSRVPDRVSIITESLGSRKVFDSEPPDGA